MDNVEVKIRKGQCMNLAVAWAIENGKDSDTQAIYEKALYFYDIICVFQDSKIEEIREVLCSANKNG